MIYGLVSKLKVILRSEVFKLLLQLKYCPNNTLSYGVER